MSFGETPVVCDWCGKQRSKDANHWMTIRCDDEGLTFQNGISRVTNYHACGHNCASIILSNWMSTGKIEKNIKLPDTSQLEAI